MIFISYSGKQSDLAGKFKKELDECHFESFLAHEDIEDDEEFLDRIWDALHRCTAFVALISADFNSSPWCQQELGVVLEIKKPRLLVKLTTADPAGFASKYQAVKASSAVNSLRTRARFRDARVYSFINGVQKVGSYAAANSLYHAFSGEWENMSDTEKRRWLEMAVKNSQVYGEGYVMGPFFKRVAAELGPTLPQSWFDADEDRWRVPNK